MSVTVTGHHKHKGTLTLAIEGQAAGGDSGRREKDSAAIYKFLRDHLPSGTLDLVAVRLFDNAMDVIIGGDLIAEDDDTHEARAAIRGLIAGLDKKPKESK